MVKWYQVGQTIGPIVSLPSDQAARRKWKGRVANPGDLPAFQISPCPWRHCRIVWCAIPEERCKLFAPTNHEPATLVGYLDAPDEETDVKQAIERFGITNPQMQKSLRAQRRP
jgi:hypothetical protein